MAHSRSSLVTLCLVGLLVFCIPSPIKASDTPSLKLESTRTLVEGTHQLSPPALQFDRAGNLILAWYDKQGETRALRAIRVGKEDLSPSPAQINPDGMEPDALHQAPGLATGPQNEIFVSWSRPKRSQDAPFAADLQLSVSRDGGASFAPPATVNDDRAPINHSFENLYIGPDGNVYLTWLDNRTKEKSGAAAQFACSRDGGRSIEKNLTIDGMACPCCRPMQAIAPDGTLMVAWRKTFEGNVRDIVLATSADQGRTFSEPRLVQNDGWAFPACPHRGPSIAFDRTGRLYIAWYTEGTDEQPRLLFAVSDDQGQTFSPPLSLHTSSTSLPDQLRMAVHPNGTVIAVWEEVTGVRKRTVMRISTNRGQSFEAVQPLSEGAKAEYPTVAVHESGDVAVSWTEHAWPNNRIVVQRGTLRQSGR
ncbi:MAG TPA: sialidase family protein [Nitrospiraceae bacterium]|nr:sialidase family protein [Nitrospiraceae bacterium]